VEGVRFASRRQVPRFRGEGDRQAPCRLRSGKTVMTGLEEHKTVMTGFGDLKTVMTGLGDLKTVMIGVGVEDKFAPHKALRQLRDAS